MKSLSLPYRPGYVGHGFALAALGAVGQDVRVYEDVLFVSPDDIRLGDGVRIDSFVKIEGGQGMTIGDYVHIASFAHVGIGGGECVIGAYAAIASGARILTGSNQPEGESMSAAAPADMQVVRRAKTIIGERAFVGVNAVIMPGIVVGEGAVVGAGAVVLHDVPAGAIVVGVPASIIDWRQYPSLVPQTESGSQMKQSENDLRSTVELTIGLTGGSGNGACTWRKIFPQTMRRCITRSQRR